MKGTKVSGYIRLIRPANGLMMFVAVIVGALVSGRASLAPLSMVLWFVTAFCLNSSSMALNDYFDRDVDAISNPNRPIPSGAVGEKGALVLAGMLGLLGLLSAWFTSFEGYLLATTAYLAAVAYNSKLKVTGFLGNLAVSYTVVAPFVYGSLVVAGTVTELVLIFSLLAFLSNTGREVIKGIPDVEGDALRGVKSVARSKGAKFASKLGASLYIIAVALSPIPYFLGHVSFYYLAVVIIADAGFVHSALSITRDPSRENARRVKKLTLAWMTIALASFLVGLL